MSWVEHHKRSERLASEAQVALFQERKTEALELYAQAADAEDKALADLDKSKVRTVGISAVSAASLYYKAGDLESAWDVAAEWLHWPRLPDFAKDQLRSLQRSIPKDRTPASIPGSFEMPGTFSHRHGYQKPEQEITVREDAPRALRQAVFPLGCGAGLRPYEIRNVVCHTLTTTPMPENSPSAEYDYENDPPELIDEIMFHLDRCDWPKVYDILEALYSYIRDKGAEDHHFSAELNRVFSEEGIGWEMISGKIGHRGPMSSIGHRTQVAVENLSSAGFSQAASEIKEAFADISRRPTPDLTGSVQHAMCAVEAAAREVTGNSEGTKSLPAFIPALNLPSPFDDAMRQLWRYASHVARHGREEPGLTEREARLMVGVAADVCSFLSSGK